MANESGSQGPSHYSAALGSAEDFLMEVASRSGVSTQPPPAVLRSSRLAELVARVRGLGAMRLVVIAAASVMTMAGLGQMVAGAPSSNVHSNTPFSSHNLVSASTIGGGLRAEEMIGSAAAVATPTATAEAAPTGEGELVIGALGATPTPGPASPPSRPRSGGQGVSRSSGEGRPRRVAQSRGPSEESEEISFGSHGGSAGLVIGAAEAHAGVVNVGSTFAAHLIAPVYTGAAAGLARAEITEDVKVKSSSGEWVAIPAGSSLHGDAYSLANEEPARVHILWRSVVVDGRTLSISAVALGPDQRLGVPGKVIKKGKRSSNAMASLGSALGSALSYEVGGVAGVAGVVASRTAGDVQGSLDRQRDQLQARRDDRVVEAGAGAEFTVYLQADFAVGKE